MILSEDDERKQSLAQFGRWFDADCFENEWAFEQLIRVIENTGKISFDSRVIKRLSELVGQYPKQSLTVIELLTRKPSQDSSILTWNIDTTKAILQEIFANDITKGDAKVFIDKLLAKRFPIFRDILYGE